jgi:hypothetical protein
LDAKRSESCLSRRAATRRHPAGVPNRVRTPCSTPSALHLGAIRRRMPRRHVSAQRLIACVPRRNQPQTRLRARILAAMGTFQLTVGQNLGHAVQIQRLPTPSRALCLETHQTRPCPRNHRPEPVRTCSRLQSGRTVTAKLAFNAHPPTPGAAGRHSLNCDGRERGRPLQHIAATAVDQLPRLVVAEARVLPSAHGLCVSVAVRQPIPTWQAPALGVLPGCSAQLIPTRACITLACNPPTDPRRSLFLACATSAGPGSAGWPRCAAITHGFQTAGDSPEGILIRASGSHRPACLREGMQAGG